MATAVAGGAQTAPRLADHYTVIAPKVIDAGYKPLWMGVFSTADLDGDGKQDLVVTGTNFTMSGLYNVPQPGRVLFGDGSGNFTAPAAGLFPVDSLETVDARRIVFGDLNGDGRLDMFIACHGWDTDPYPGEQNRLYLSRPDGGWSDATGTLPRLDDYTHSAAMGDLGGRGVLDIVAGNYFGGLNQINSYALLNDGSGHFTMTRADIPAGPGETMDAKSGHWFLSTTLADLDGDGFPELILGASGINPVPYGRLTNATVLWNQRGTFTDGSKTELPLPAPFLASHIDLDIQPIDFNGDGLPDLVVVGSQSSPQAFYDGWFVQLLENRGDRTFVDVTANLLAPGDASAGMPGVATATSWPVWVKVLDFNGDGLPDFAVEYWFPTGPPTSGDSPGKGLAPGLPLVYLNDGRGHFSTLKVADFVVPGDEWRLGGGHLVPTQDGFSFITPYLLPIGDGLHLTGLLATRPYRSFPAKSVEYYNERLGHYFMTAQADEIAGLDAGAYDFAFARTGRQFSVHDVQAPGTMPVCRFFTTPGRFGTKGSHFYTADPVECAGLKLNPDWIYEKIAFYIQLPNAGACPGGTVPVYRAFNNGQSGAPNHRFTTDAGIYQQFTTLLGWSPEGIKFCAPP